MEGTKIAGPGGFARTVVVKRILPYLLNDARFVKMFLAEARLSALLHHPNIVQVYQLEEVAGEWALAMEYVAGRDLSTVLALTEGTAQPPGLGAFVMREVCRALAYAHGFTSEDGRSAQAHPPRHQPVEPDAGLRGRGQGARLRPGQGARRSGHRHQPERRAARQAVVSLSPELVGGMAPDHRADQYAVGVVLYELLTGRRLHGGSPTQILAAVSASSVNPPSRINPEVPAALDRICLRALERDREARFASCEEMGRELEEVVHQLRWSHERLASWLRELAPAALTTSELLARVGHGEDGDDNEPLPPTSKVEASDTLSPPGEVEAVIEESTRSFPPAQPATEVPPPGRARGVWLIGSAATTLVAAAGWWLLSRPRVVPVGSAPSVVVTPPVVVSPPVAAAPPVTATPPVSAPRVAAASGIKASPPRKKPHAGGPDLDKGDIVDPFSAKKGP